MTEIDNLDPGAQPSASKSVSSHHERVGDILRREREKRQISVEVIAKKLRLNAKYIEDLEANHYDRLPGDTYIRVYLRSLSQYLSLDAEELLQRFFDERGLIGADTLRKDSSTKIHLTALNEAKKSNLTLFIALSLIVVLAAFAFFVQKKGWLSSHANKAAAAAIDSTKPPGGGTVPGAVPENVGHAEAVPARSVDTGKSAVNSVAPGSDTLRPPADLAGSLPVSSPKPASVAGRPMKLSIAVWADSCRLRVYCDGHERRGVLPKGKALNSIAYDSFNVHVDPVEAASFAINGKSFTIPVKKGAAALKVGREGVEPWSLEKWETTFH